ncbi:MAG: peptidoglycan editing factor PgeF [Rhodobacteraceae bacterium]|jgi:YfiH family protein|uniref:peptidoglycan editing factor PgeF n=1 Tax=Roseovarius sp. 10 TaxID=3080563 RepID=UPI0019361A8A|nr:peptidoglycan editing factor PgeF [Roseovarius sp. 10]MBE1290639.1 peptidoglycan editing factor PgeF [Paracoccaceae bacterium]MDV7201408.1 peptidoglycan editing factor PgeF [Roseovarius sp. 10]QPI86491.1 peptidoglycan editing factor PgeF [Rhodobacterales bacterium HKCCA1288]
MAAHFAPIDPITSPLLGAAKHGFFTRKGGASSGIFSSLNCGAGSSDQSDLVEINRARVAREMGVAEDCLVTVYQTHSADVVLVEGPIGGGTPEADGLVSCSKDLAIAILTADCQPVLFHEAEAGVIGAAHAGWKGARAGVLEATIDLMVAQGAVREKINAVIGPTISQANYEVGQEFFEEFVDDDPESARFFINGAAPDKYLFDLPSYGLTRLRNAGIGQAEWCGHCTYRDEELFFSYRRATHRGEADYGRLISAIRL